MAETSEPVERVEFLDSDVICRYLTADHPEHGPRARSLIDSDRLLRISIVMLAEVAHVLRSVYKRSPEQIADALMRLLNRENIAIFEVDTDRVIEALELTRPSRRVSVPDALLWASARSATPARIWSFDEKFPSEGIEVTPPYLMESAGGNRT